MNLKKAALFIIITALLATAGSFAPNSALPARAQSQTSASHISTDRISRHVAHLASDKLKGRRAGTEGANQAAEYIAKEFRSYGLNTAQGADFLQPFSFVAGVRLGERNSLRINHAGRTHALKVGADFMPLAFSSSAKAKAEMVFVGYGISAPELQYDDYAGADVKGKVVAMLRGGPDGDNPHSRFAEHTAPGLEVQKKTIKAREKGAIAVVFISSEKDFKQDRLSRLQHDLNFLDAGIPAVIISRQVADSIPGLQQQKKAEIKDVVVELGTDVVKIEGKSANVVGILKGSDPQLANEYVVIGAHYDHLGLGGVESLAQNPEGAIHHGADDNASGTAALMELARVMAATRPAPKRSVVFAAFGAEEMGLLGSAAYTKNPVVSLSSTVAMLNMDMVGRLRNDSLFVGGVGTSPAWKPLLEKLNAAESFGFNLSTGQDGFGPSDHQSFYVRDVPVLFFFTGTHDDYHKPSDTAEKVNAEGITRIASLVRDVTLSVANEPARIAFTRVKTETRPTGRGFRVYLGTVPNYSDQGDGMKLDGVRAGSPAERAGLRPGDIITKLGTIPIKNVYDYTYALGELRPGEEVEVRLRRDGSELLLRLTPDKRQ